MSRRTTSFFAEWSVYRLVQETGVTVMLDGQGADEALAGYHSFFAPYLASLVRDRRFGDAWREMQAFKRRHGYSEVRAVRGVARVAGAHERSTIRQRLGRCRTHS